MSTERDPLLEVFFFETNQLLDELEGILLTAEQENEMTSSDIDEIFRIMHTIKGSSAMMNFNGISKLAHAIEDLFDIFRKGVKMDFGSTYDVVLSALDFAKEEVAKLERGYEADGDPAELIKQINELASKYKSEGKAPEKKGKGQASKKAKRDEKKETSGIVEKWNDNYNRFKVKIRFEDGCMMENVRAFSLVFSLNDLCKELYYRPHNISEDNSTAEYIVENGFDMYLVTEKSKEEIYDLIVNSGACVKECQITTPGVFYGDMEDIYKYFVKEEESEDDVLSSINHQIAQVKKEVEELTKQEKSEQKDIKKEENEKKAREARGQNQTFINVNTEKLDKLMDLVGEIVIAESMVSANPDIKDLNLENFQKATDQLRKLIDSLQDSVMSIRMVPIASTFQSMRRIVRDMGKKLNKDVDLVLLGEDTEVDKNIISHISDPLMHLVRNAMDHGIETADERVKAGKNPKGKITLSASNTGAGISISVSDDGRGLDREKILEKAKEKGLLTKPESELSDREVYSFILHPGFSTRETVTEFSGRGVGMDVVSNNIAEVGGSIYIQSEKGKGKGMTVHINIPLTLAIIDGMELSVGENILTIPILYIKEAFKANKKDIIKDTDNNEMIMLRGNCYPIIRLHEIYKMETEVTDLSEGIMLLVQSEDQSACIFADKLNGERSVVVKPLPNYYAKMLAKKGGGIGGCTILGNGDISLILDVKGLIRRVI